jgi:hypothetical protein
LDVYGVGTIAAILAALYFVASLEMRFTINAKMQHA